MSSCTQDCTRTLSIDYIGDMSAPTDFDCVVVDVQGSDGTRSQQGASPSGSFEQQRELIQLTDLRNGARLHIELRHGASVVYSMDHGPLVDVEAPCSGRRVLPIAVISHLP